MLKIKKLLAHFGILELLMERLNVELPCVHNSYMYLFTEIPKSHIRFLS
jgi:hypothetical protein